MRTRVKVKLNQIIKIMIFMLSMQMITACLMPPSRTSLDNAIIYNWQNQYVTFEQFTRDHLKCFGIESIPQQSQFQKTMDPLTPRVMPKWDGIWATFESRRYRETSQRIAVQTPPGTNGWSTSQYKACMYKKGYYLIY